MGFYRSNNPTDSVKALREVVVLRIDFNPIDQPHHVTNLYMHTVYNNTHNTCKNESKHSEMGPVRQNPIQRTARSVHMCVHHTVHNCCTQYCTEHT